MPVHKRALVGVLSRWREREEETEALVQLLRRDHEVVERTSPSELLTAVPRARMSALLCDAGIFLDEPANLRELIEQLPCVALTGVDGEELQRARELACGVEVVMLDQPLGPFVERLRRKLAPRSNDRVSCNGLDVQFVADGRPLRFTLTDVSNEGFAFRAPASAGRWLPGAALSTVRVTVEDRVLLDSPQAVLRSVRVDADRSGGLAYRIGAEFVASAVVNAGAELKVVDPGRVRELVDQAVALDLLVLRLHDDSASMVRPHLVRIQDPDRLFVRASFPVAPESGDLIAGRFEVQGASYTFSAAILALARTAGAIEFSMRIPRVLTGIRRRRAARFRPGLGNAPSVYLRSPFGGVCERFPVINLTSHGVAVRIGREHVFPIGTLVPEVNVQFAGGQRLSCQARVRSLYPEGGGLRCGLELEWAPSDRKGRLAHAIAAAGRPDVVTMTGVAPGTIWQLLERSGFLYAEKKATVDQKAAEQTLSRLAAAENDVFKGALFIRAGNPHGHISAIRAYSRTWIIHHLSALPGGRQDSSLARVLILSMLEYLEQRPEAEWIRVYYRPENRWPARVFGSLARVMSDARLSSHKVFHYLRPSEKGPVPPASDLWVRPAQGADLEELEAFFVDRADHLAVAAEDLCTPELLLDTVSGRYQPLGLERRREVMVAERYGEPVGFALLEISSPGLNLSELTSAFRLFVPERDRQARRALAAAASLRYLQLGRRPAALAEAHELEAFAGAGLEATKRYVSWTLHRSLIPIAFDSILAGLQKEQRRESERPLPHGERERMAAPGAEDRPARVVA